MMITLSNSFSHQIQPLVILKPFQISRLDSPLNLRFSLNQKTNVGIEASKSQKPCPTTDRKKREEKSVEEGIPIDQVKTLVKFKSRYNYIRVIQVSRRADHPFAGSRLLLLDTPGNIHSVSFIFKLLTGTYFDVFATFPPVLPPGGGPVGILGFGAGSAARIILELYPEVVIHGWELDPSVISVGREYFSLSKLENDNPNRLFISIGNALNAGVKGGFSGILVDLFCKGSVIPELQDSRTWEKLKGSLRKGGRIMVNVGGSCIEPEDSGIDGKMVMEETLEAMHKVFPGQLFVLSLGRRKEDSAIALTGDLPDLDSWRLALPASLRGYVKMWTPLDGVEVAERALFLWNNDHIVSLIAHNRQVILPLIYPALEKNAQGHWNQAVLNLTLNVRKMFAEMDNDLVLSYQEKFEDEAAKLKAVCEKRTVIWERLENVASFQPVTGNTAVLVKQ